VSDNQSLSPPPPPPPPPGYSLPHYYGAPYVQQPPAQTTGLAKTAIIATAAVLIAGMVIYRLPFEQWAMQPAMQQSNVVPIPAQQTIAPQVLTPASQQTIAPEDNRKIQSAQPLGAGDGAFMIADPLVAQQALKIIDALPGVIVENLAAHRLADLPKIILPQSTQTARWAVFYV
jgi:hypothetical protein